MERFTWRVVDGESYMERLEAYSRTWRPEAEDSMEMIKGDQMIKCLSLIIIVHIHKYYTVLKSWLTNRLKVNFM